MLLIRKWNKCFKKRKKQSASKSKTSYLISQLVSIKKWVYSKAVKYDCETGDQAELSKPQEKWRTLKAKVEKKQRIGKS